MTRQTIHRPENGLPVVIVRDEPRIDSRIVAEELGIQHDNLVQNIRKYIEEIESLGETIEVTTRTGESGRPPKFFLLTEAQCGFIVTICRTSKAKTGAKHRFALAFKAFKEMQGTNSHGVTDFARLFGPLVTGRLAA
ncbi:Phage pRha domain containing protein [Laribacter hongkongensis HLHK9]|uniref:Phage pRha domain containing protein n=1 Tax=Laribacter hongkongensis (strain HLHK9) TaxID=557598 RepID=C1D7T0_LARHH|nr:Rha family transcriptional regulator [Laribacter hongkongensis]ACO74520.1 Phage pRha domain containing protein [Laribacter hongkongensis HLHK9]